MHLVRLAAVTLAVLYGAYVGRVVVRVAGADHWLSLLLFFCWAVSPVAALVGVRYKKVGAAGVVGDMAWLLALVAMAAFGIHVYQEAFFGSRPDAQSSLLLIFIPLYQWAGAALMLVLLAIASPRADGGDDV